MVKQRSSQKSAGASASSAGGGRASDEAVEKRRVARQLNSALGGSAKRGTMVDGRTEKRRQRLLEELKEGKGGAELKPIEFVSAINELLGLGENMTSLRRQGIKTRRLAASDEVMAIVRRAQEAYSFHADAWRMLGIPVEEKERPSGAVRRGRRPGSKKK